MAGAEVTPKASSEQGNATLAQTGSRQLGLLDLPREIRDVIYGHALGGNILHVVFRGGRLEMQLCHLRATENHDYERCVCEAERSEFHVRHLACHSQSQPVTLTAASSFALSLVCRQLRRETASLPFELNSFAFQRITDFTPFVDLLLPCQQRAIRSVVLSDHVGWYSQSVGSGTFRMLSGLTEFTYHGNIQDADDTPIPEDMQQELRSLDLHKVRICLFLSHQPSEEIMAGMETMLSRLEAALLHR